MGKDLNKASLKAAIRRVDDDDTGTLRYREYVSGGLEPGRAAEEFKVIWPLCSWVCRCIPWRLCGLASVRVKQIVWLEILGFEPGTSAEELQVV